MFDLNSSNLAAALPESPLSDVEMLNMAREILSVIQKRYPDENASLKEFSCDGEKARCVYTINEKEVLDIKF